MSISAPASDTTGVDGEHARPTLFAPGGPPGGADPDHAADATTTDGADGSAPPTLADLFSTHTRAHGDDDGDDHVLDLRDLLGPDGEATQIDLTLLDTMAVATEAIEYVERARGHLYTLHHLLTRADILFAEVAASLREQGRIEEAQVLEARVIGRNVIDDRWSFEVVEAFDDGFYGPVRGAVRDLERRTVGGRRHAREAALKHRRSGPDDLPVPAGTSESADESPVDGADAGGDD